VVVVSAITPCLYDFCYFRVVCWLGCFLFLRLPFLLRIIPILDAVSLPFLASLLRPVGWMIWTRGKG